MKSRIHHPTYEKTEKKNSHDEATAYTQLCVLDAFLELTVMHVRINQIGNQPMLMANFLCYAI